MAPSQGMRSASPVQGPDFDTSEIKSTTMVLIADGSSGQQAVDAFGLLLQQEDGLTKLEEPLFGTPAAPSLDSF